MEKLTEATFKLLLPMACAWAEKQERVIHRNGVVLTPALIADARRIGVKYPERVRLRAVEEIPMPVHPVLMAAAEKFGVVSPQTIGLTLQYGIFIRSDCWGDRRLVVHELAHTAQYERLGGIRAFLEQYLRECLLPGYPFGDLEQEAKRVEREICG
jgi:hypothetical protein